MSVERIGVPVAAEALLVTTERETEQRTPKHAKELGRRALELDGFIVLDMAASPYDHVREKLESRVVDQPAAIDAIIEAIERSSVRLESDNRPIANLAFLGPTGVGKSETAKTLSTLMADGKSNLIKIDCSNFSQGHEVMALIGSPPSYVGHDITPQFSKEAVEQPGTVILFDEIEKGSTELYNLMLQIMGDGQLRLNNGNSVSFRETIVVLTSNLGAREMSDQLSPSRLGFVNKDSETDKESLEKIARKSFTDFFSPEFANRLNKVVVFHPLGTEALSRVLDVKVAEASAEYEKQFGVRLTLSDATREHLVNIAAEEPHLGARPLVRALEENIQTTFGRYSTRGLPEGTHVRVIHRTEVPDTYRVQGDGALIFTAKPDASIRKQRVPIALPAAPEINDEAPDVDLGDDPEATEE